MKRGTLRGGRIKEGGVEEHVCVCVHLFMHPVTHHTQMTILSNTRKTMATDTDMAITAVMAEERGKEKHKRFLSQFLHETKPGNNATPLTNIPTIIKTCMQSYRPYILLSP